MNMDFVFLKTKLNLASGNEYLDDFYNVDDCSMYPDCKVDCKMDLKQIELPNECLEVIKLSHFVMYTRPDELKPLLTRWYGWLKPGGTLEIECIDVKTVARIVVSSRHAQDMVNDWGLTNLFGNATTGPHRWGWTAKSLTPLLYQAGFSDVKVKKGVKKPDRDFLIIATK